MTDSFPHRIPESEIMSEEEAYVYYENNRHVGEDDQYKMIENFDKCCGFFGHTILDLGCGIGNLPIYLAQKYPQAVIVGVDASEEMINRGRILVDKFSLTHRVILKKAHIPCDTIIEKKNYFDAVFSRSTLHHFKNGLDFWKTVKENSHPNSSIFVFDLIRPLDADSTLKFINTRLRPDAPKALRESYFNSFLAAFRPREIMQLMTLARLEGKFRIMNVGGTHMIIFRKGIP